MPRDKNKVYLRAPKENYKPETFNFQVRIPKTILNFYTREQLAEKFRSAVLKKLNKKAA